MYAGTLRRRFADMVADAIGELYPAHTHVVEPEMLPTVRILDCAAHCFSFANVLYLHAQYSMPMYSVVYVKCMSILHALASTNDATHVYLACLAFGAVGSDM